MAKLDVPQESIFKQMLAEIEQSNPNVLDVADTEFDPDTPPDVIITKEARVPIFDPTLGVSVEQGSSASTSNRLVAIGDSLTHGFQSGAIFNTSISYPAIIAHELGWDGFRFPTYRGFGGLPLNIEYLVRQLEHEFGSTINWWELALALFKVRNLMGQIEDWWERGAGSHVPQYLDVNHNLAVYGWDVRDVLSRTGDYCNSQIGKPKDQLLRQVVENANERAALRTLNFVDDPSLAARNKLSVLDQAKSLGQTDQIETLIVFIGANNALGSILQLKVIWSDVGFDDLKTKSSYNVWRPIHFEKEFNILAEEVEEINARRVIFAGVPHVTIAPVAHGIGQKIRPDSRYFPNYSRPWIKDSEFDSKIDPNITAQQARAIDSAIDQYNYCIVNAVKKARQDGKSWFFLDCGGMLDRLACRRYIDSPSARPSWWTKYPLPAEFEKLEKAPDSQFYSTSTDGKIKTGGLFSLDGVHPTTITYGILAQEFINIMQSDGVTFFLQDGKTPRTGPVRVDFNRLLTLDTLISDPPKSVGSDLQLIGWLNHQLDFVERMLLRS